MPGAARLPPGDELARHEPHPARVGAPEAVDAPLVRGISRLRDPPRAAGAALHDPPAAVCQEHVPAANVGAREERVHVALGIRTVALEDGAVRRRGLLLPPAFPVELK